MPYDENLAKRIKSILISRCEVSQKKMFGSLCFLFNGNMLCAVNGDKLMARVGQQNYEFALKQKHVTEMDFTGKSLKGMVYVLQEGIKRKDSLKKWINICIDFVSMLPKKK
jgi:TfoX/Sxy family transcriptional regulator of competence genes